MSDPDFAGAEAAHERLMVLLGSAVLALAVARHAFQSPTASFEVQFSGQDYRHLQESWGPLIDGTFLPLMVNDVEACANDRISLGSYAIVVYGRAT